jgi:two-component system nitrogen regulation response regulator GlnG
MGLEAKRFSPAALGALQKLPWPGNVRQLENLCRRLAVMAPGREIRVQDLPPQDAEVAAAADDWRIPLQRAVRERLAQDDDDIYASLREEFDAAVLNAALAVSDNQRGRAAQRVGLGRNTLTRKLGSSRRRRHKDH